MWSNFESKKPLFADFKIVLKGDTAYLTITIKTRSKTSAVKMKKFAISTITDFSTETLKKCLDSYEI